MYDRQVSLGIGKDAETLKQLIQDDLHKPEDDFKNLALGFEYNLLPSEVAFNPADEKISFDELDVAGGIISTVKDCVKWNNALYHDKIIPNHLVDLMLLQHIPAIPFPTYYGLDRVWYGYGIEVYYEGQKICYSHAGGCPGYQSRLTYLPVSNITIVHLSNSQKDNENSNAAKKMLSDEHQCDLAAIDAMFDEKFPHYKSRLQNRINIFDFANELRGILL